MGTRHLIVVIYKGQWRIAQYGQWDGYPDAVGMRLVRLFASKDFADKVREGLAHTYLVSDEEEVYRMMQSTREARARLDPVDIVDDDGKLVESKFARFCEDPVNRYSDEMLEMLPSLHHYTSSAVLVLVAHATAEKRLPIYLNTNFANNSISCEWAYIVDLDAETLEVYGGPTEKTPENRFSHIGTDEDSVPTYVMTASFGQLDLYKDDQAAFMKVVNEKIGVINEERRAARKDLDQ